MAEAHKPGILAVAQKRLARTKTKVLQSLKKAERSTDESFDDLVLKADKQHEVAHHVQKEFKAYVHCVRALSTACKSLTTTLAQTYETEWTDQEQFKELLMAQTLLWENYGDNFQSSVIEPLNNYIASFPALKNKVAKRGRKMVDYDTARHSLEVLQEAKKKDDPKISKAQEELNDSKRIYEDLHAELCTELPDFYNSRVTFYADLFQKLYGCESQLHSELLRISESQAATAQRLSKEYVEFVYTPKRPLSKSLSDKNIMSDITLYPTSKTKHSSDESSAVNGEYSPRVGTDSPASSASPATSPLKATYPSLPRPSDSQGAVGGEEEEDKEDEDNMYSNQDAIETATKINGTEKIFSQQQQKVDAPTGSDFRHNATSDSARSDHPRGAVSDSFSGDLEPDYITMGDFITASSKDNRDTRQGASNVYEAPVGHADDDSDSDDAGLYQSPPSNQPVYQVPPNVLYIVDATHTYIGEDVDELSFEPGDVIYVIPFDDPEEQDHGWQLGIKQKDGVKGVFPENFTAQRN